MSIDIFQELLADAESEFAARLYTRIAVATVPESFLFLVAPPPPPPVESSRSLPYFEAYREAADLQRWIEQIHLVEPGFPEDTKTYVFSELVNWMVEANSYSSETENDEDVTTSQLRWRVRPGEPIAYEPTIVFDFDPSKETLEKAIDRARRNVGVRLALFRAECAVASGREPFWGYLEKHGVKRQHFEWLALRQIRGLGNTEIRKRDNVTESAVRYGIRRAAGHLQVPVADLRKIPRGRPPGVQDQWPRHRVDT